MWSHLWSSHPCLKTKLPLSVPKRLSQRVVCVVDQIRLLLEIHHAVSVFVKTRVCQVLTLHPGRKVIDDGGQWPVEVIKTGYHRMIVWSCSLGFHLNTCQFLLSSKVEFTMFGKIPFSKCLRKTPSMLLSRNTLNNIQGMWVVAYWVLFYSLWIIAPFS